MKIDFNSEKASTCANEELVSQKHFFVEKWPGILGGWLDFKAILKDRSVEIKSEKGKAAEGEYMATLQAEKGGK